MADCSHEWRLFCWLFRNSGSDFAPAWSSGTRSASIICIDVNILIGWALSGVWLPRLCFPLSAFPVTAICCDSQWHCVPLSITGNSFWNLWAHSRIRAHCPSLDELLFGLTCPGIGFPLALVGWALFGIWLPRICFLLPLFLDSAKWHRRMV